MRPPLLRLLPLLLALAACGNDAAEAPATDAPTTDSPRTDAPPVRTPDGGEAPPPSPLGLPDDRAALAAYTLTMERVEGWHRAVQNLQRLAEEDPALAETWEVDDAGPDSFDEMIAQIEAEPRTRRAIEQAGISARDYVLTSLAIVQAMFAQAVVDVGQPLPEGINPANVEFVRAHEAELQAMFASVGMEE